MLRIQARIQTAEMPQNAFPITPLQQSGCSISAIFARAIQFFKDLFNRICSCGQKPPVHTFTSSGTVSPSNPPAPVVDPNVLPVPPEIQDHLPPPIQNEIDAPALNNPAAQPEEAPRPPVLAEPQQLLVGHFIDLMDIDAVNDYIRALEIARHYENVLREPVPDALARWYHYEPRHVETTLAALLEHKEVLETTLNDEDFLARVNAMELAEVETRIGRLEFDDPRLDTLLERGSHLHNIALPREILDALPGWDLDRLSQEIVVYSDRRTLHGRRLLHLEGEAEAREQAELDLACMVLRHLRERFNEINPPPDLDEFPLEPIAAQPEEAPRPPILAEPARLPARPYNPDEIELMDHDNVKDYLIGLQNVWYFVNVSHMQPNPEEAALYNYDPRTVDATLAAIRQRKAQLETIMHDVNFLPNWDEMTLPEVQAGIRRCRGVIDRSDQLRNLQGEARGQVRRELDLAYAEFHMLQERTRLINWRDA